MSLRFYALISNAAMLLYITCWMARNCYQMKEINNDTWDPYSNYSVYLCLSISGSCFIIIGLFLALLRSFSEVPSMAYASYGSSTVGYALITLGMFLGSSQGLFKDQQKSFDIPLDEWIGLTAVYLQSMLNAYEHDDVEEVTEEVQTQQKIEL